MPTGVFFTPRWTRQNLCGLARRPTPAPKRPRQTRRCLDKTAAARASRCPERYLCRRHDRHAFERDAFDRSAFFAAATALRGNVCQALDDIVAFDHLGERG